MFQTVPHIILPITLASVSACFQLNYFYNIFVISCQGIEHYTHSREENIFIMKKIDVGILNK